MKERLERLDDYLRGHGGEAEAAAFEEDLFRRAIANDAPELATYEAFARAFRAMKETGTLGMWLTEREAKAVLARNDKALLFNLDLKNLQPVRIPDDVEVFITRVPIDLSGFSKVDVEVLTPEGRLLKTMPDVEFDPADGAVFACCEADLARASVSVNSVTRVWGTNDSGKSLIATIPVGL